MNLTQVIPPAAALVTVLSWNIWQWKQAVEQQEQTAALRARLDSAKVAALSSKASGGLRNPTSHATGPDINWDDLSVRLQDIRSGSGAGARQEMVDLHNRLSNMSREELLAAWNEVSSMGLSDKARKPLEDLLIGSLVAVDPKLALEKFASRIGENSDRVSKQLAMGLREWAAKDPAAAAAWLDGQIHGGLFDTRSLAGYNGPRLEFEASLVEILLGTDPSAAAMRIAALPEEQRREALQRIIFSKLDDSARRAYVQLVRGLVPKDENPGTFTHIISELVPHGGYELVDAFLDQINASTEERMISARQAANSQLGELASQRVLTHEDVESMRDWLKTQSPGKVDTVTGEALGEVVQDGGKLSFQEASGMVLEYQKKSGSDDVLLAFIRSFEARSNLKQVASLVDMIKDPKTRAEIHSQLN